MSYKDRDKQRAFQVVWRDARREEFITSKDGKCSTCGSTDRLEVDHIDRSLKTMNPTRIWTRTKEIRDKELLNCQVLCYVCHKEKTIKERKVEHPHGVYAKYSSGCRCTECRASNAYRNRVQRANKKDII
jgi:5-methylcytosine-specific restriction endonuclease McrA